MAESRRDNLKKELAELERISKRYGKLGGSLTAPAIKAVKAEVAALAPRRLSAAARRQISKRMKAYWAAKRKSAKG